MAGKTKSARIAQKTIPMDAEIPNSLICLMSAVRSPRNPKTVVPAARKTVWTILVTDTGIQLLSGHPARRRGSTG